MNNGFLPGDTLHERLEALSEPHRLRELLPEVTARVDEFLAKAAALVRERFGGKVTYAAIQFERVDWTRFDIVSVDLYRSIEIADRFAEGVRAHVVLDRRPSRGPGPGQLRHRQGPRRRPRRGLSRHALGAQGRIQNAGRVPLQLTATSAGPISRWLNDLPGSGQAAFKLPWVLGEVAGDVAE